ncbi:MAG: hypothetical protein FWE06_08020 [Oscillospiraceae bacterium]|nr:hypothetical protein [Oscillospiraceae bacterium]
MTDREYTALIYCRVFHVENDNGDAYTDGIMKMLDTLHQREQTVLHHYYRYGKTLEQVGNEIGLARASVGAIRKKAIIKLRHPSRLRNMSMTNIKNGK